jgi:hypothetical protein
MRASHALALGLSVVIAAFGFSGQRRVKADSGGLPVYFWGAPEPSPSKAKTRTNSTSSMPHWEWSAPTEGTAIRSTVSRRSRKCSRSMGADERYQPC